MAPIVLTVWLPGNLLGKYLIVRGALVLHPGP
jgi:hypothetical protein